MESSTLESTTSFGRFFLPGPTEVHPEVLGAQDQAVIGHRGPAIKELMAELQTGLRDLFRTQSPVLISHRPVRRGTSDRTARTIRFCL